MAELLSVIRDHAAFHHDDLDALLDVALPWRADERADQIGQARREPRLHQAATGDTKTGINWGAHGDSFCKILLIVCKKLPNPKQKKRLSAAGSGRPLVRLRASGPPFQRIC